MINVLSDTFRFMSAAGQLDTVGFPADTTDQLRCLRRSLLTEEFHEYRDAEWANDVVVDAFAGFDDGGVPSSEAGQEDCY